MIELAAAFVVVAFAAAAQGTVGMGFNILAVPVMALINPALAPVPQLILSLPLTIGSVARERAGVDRSGVFWILMGRFPGAAIGVWLLSIATDRSLDLFIGSMVLGAVLMLASGIRLVRTRSVEFATGVFAGISSYVATIGGPPVALLYSKDEGATVRATLGLIFLLGSTITLLARTVAGDITGSDVVIGVSLFPAAAIGFAFSSRLKERVTARHLRVAILSLSSVAAVALLSRAI
ncbi:MAG: sulfite exporter TauE/SafE family protein [bacterium]|nr:sulfite exporter TauE/SafE family protein [bacterium]